MLAFRLFLSFFCPPLAITKSGCLSLLVVTFLWLAFWPLATGIACTIVVFDEIEDRK